MATIESLRLGTGVRAPVALLLERILENPILNDAAVEHRD